MDLMEIIRNALEAEGIDLDKLTGADGAPARVVTISANLADAAKAFSGASRDQVVMMRVDKETSDALDAWVEAGIAKSRSEAAALFMREGLSLRANELAELAEAVAAVNAAREKLRAKAARMTGRDRAEE
jgi:hypothetical protein